MSDNNKFIPPSDAEVVKANNFVPPSDAEVVSSPKSLAPSMEDVKSGAVKIPSTPASASVGSKSASWTETVNPLAAKAAVQPVKPFDKTKASSVLLNRTVPESPL